MIKRLLSACAAITAVTAAPAATPQRPALDRPMLPYALQYAACAHAAAGSCEQLREALIARSEPVLRRYNPGDMLQSRPRFVRLLDGIDQGAADLRREGKPPSAALIGYLQCLGDAFVADPGSSRELGSIRSKRSRNAKTRARPFRSPACRPTKSGARAGICSMSRPCWRRRVESLSATACSGCRPTRTLDNHAQD